MWFLPTTLIFACASHCQQEMIFADLHHRKLNKMAERKLCFLLTTCSRTNVSFWMIQPLRLNLVVVFYLRLEQDSGCGEWHVVFPLLDGNRFSFMSTFSDFSVFNSSISLFPVKSEVAQLIVQVLFAVSLLLAVFAIKP